MKWIGGFVWLVWLLCSAVSLSLFVYAFWKHCLREYKWSWVILAGIFFLQGGVKEGGGEGESGLTGCGSAAHQLHRLEKKLSVMTSPQTCIASQGKQQHQRNTTYLTHPKAGFVSGLWRSAKPDTTCLAINLLNLMFLQIFSTVWVYPRNIDLINLNEQKLTFHCYLKP